MMHLPTPGGAGDAQFEAVWNAEQWQPYRDDWAAATAAYRAAGGDPWQVEPMQLGEEIEADQRILWDRKRKTPAIETIRHIRLPCCPVCGSQTTGSVDHYLPKETFAEFAILFENLIPSCVHCNSAGKGRIYRGDGAPERFIHPYYDDWVNVALWRVEIEPPFEAPTFAAVPVEGLAAPYSDIMVFHLKHVLGKQWLAFNERTWGGLPDRLVGRVSNDAPTTAAVVQTRLDERQWESDRFDGVNCWYSALLRGIRNNGGALAFIAGRTEQLAALLVEQE